MAPKSKVVDLETEKNSPVDHFFIQGRLEVETRPANLQIILKTPLYVRVGEMSLISPKPPRKFYPNFRDRLLI